MRTCSRRWLGCIAVAVTWAAVSPALAQQPVESVPERPAAAGTPASIPLLAKQIKPGLFLITGRGGNSVVRVTPEGVILIDNKVMRDSVYRELRDMIAAKTGNTPIKVVFMTHHHADHVGNNARFIEGGAQVIGQRNVVETLRNYKSTIAPRNPAPPTVTFDERYTVTLGGVVATAYHWGPAHTNADAAVYFPDQRVLVAGGILLADGEPEIDALDAGGSLLGLQQRLTDILKVDFELVIPGYGENAMTRPEVVVYKKKIDTLVSRLRAAVRRGVPQDQLLATVDTSDLALRLVGHFWTEPERLAPIYRELSSSKRRK